MPHSITPEPSSPVTEAVMGEVEMVDEGLIHPGGTPQESGTDSAMSGTLVESQETDSLTTDANAIKTEVKAEVKLEDLFADVESDEEFPSSNIDAKVSSSPEAPASPLYALHPL
jgi:DNA primase small subunit